MRIGINGRAISSRQYTGIGRYVSNLLDSLSAIDRSNQYHVYVPKGLFDQKRVVPRFASSNITVKTDWLKRGLAKTLKGLDIYHAPSFEVVDIKNVKVVATIHDLVYKAFPEGHTDETIRLTDLQINSYLPTASKIICCSQNTINDLHRFFKFEKERVCLIYQGVDKKCFYPIGEQERWIAQEALKKKGIDGPFLLFVGTIERRKNLRILLQAFAMLKEKGTFRGKLVVAGMMGWKEEHLMELVDQLKIRHEILILGFVSNEELRYLYNEAEAFVFPSFYEGFGFPVLEAFSCGAAVVCSKTSSCPEVAGDAALLVDPHDAQDMAEAIKRVVKNPQLKKELKAKALKRAEHFSFKKTAEETLKIYNEVVQSK